MAGCASGFTFQTYVILVYFHVYTYAELPFYCTHPARCSLLKQPSRGMKWPS